MPDEIFAESIGDRLAFVVEKHIEYLLVRSKEHYDKFQNLLKSEPEAAKAEAAVFALLRNYFRVNPEVLDAPGTGGTDFLCKPAGRDQFVVEVTSLLEETVENRSGIPAEIGEDAFVFSMVTQALQSKIKRKAEQMADYPSARVLVIGTTHHAAAMLLETEGASLLLTSDPKIRVTIGDTPTDPQLTTNLANSAFFRPTSDGDIEACRKSVSAVILMGIYDHEDQLVGVLHPEPAFPLDINNFPQVPFVRMAQWPVVNGEIKTEWVVSNPKAYSFYHMATKLTDEELRGE